jgi:hypothetical protein
MHIYRLEPALDLSLRAWTAIDNRTTRHARLSFGHERSVYDRMIIILNRQQTNLQCPKAQPTGFTLADAERGGDFPNRKSILEQCGGLLEDRGRKSRGDPTSP